MPRKRKGAPYRRTVITFWNDPLVKGDGDKVPGLSLEEKAVLLYLFTNEHSHPCGVYRLPPAYVLEELGVDRRRLRDLLAGPLKPFASYDWQTMEVFVHTMARHQIDGGLFGKDNRIAWVMNQLSLIHSEPMLRAFRHRYAEWGLDFSTILPNDDPDQLTIGGETFETDGKVNNPNEREGPSTAPSQAPSPNDSGRNGQAGQKDQQPQQKGRGSGVVFEASPSPSPSPREEKPPVLSSKSSKRNHRREGEVEGKKGREEHPHLEAIWPRIERGLYAPWWHGGNGVVILGGGKTVSLDLERLLANDLLWKTDHPELVAWAVENASRIFDWDASQRHTLYWLKEPENVARAEGEFHKAAPVADGPVDLLTDGIGSMPDPPKAERDRRAQLQGQVAAMRTREKAEPDDPLTEGGTA